MDRRLVYVRQYDMKRKPRGREQFLPTLGLRCEHHISVARALHEACRNFHHCVLLPAVGAQLPRRPKSRNLASCQFAQPAASAVRISAGRDFEPVFFMVAARWLSTVRWLMPRSAAMFLLGWPARTRPKICRWRAVRLGTRIAAVSCHSDSLAVSRLSDGAVIVDDEYGRRPLPLRKERQLPRALWRSSWGLGEEALDVVRQLLCPHRLV